MNTYRASRRLARYLRGKAKAIGANPEEITVYKGGSDNWAFSEHTPCGSYAVCWESGPSDWALLLCGGTSIYAAEVGCYRSPGDFDTELPGVMFEPIVSFAVGVYLD